MSDPKNPFADLMAQAQDMAKAMNPAFEALSSKAMEDLWQTLPRDVMEKGFGKGASADGLDAKTRLLLTLAGLTMLGAQNELQITLTVRHALEAGATKDEVTETIAQMGMFAGLPSMNRALEFARKVLDGPEEKEQET